MRDFVNIFPDEEKIIECQEQKKCQRFTPSIRKKSEITRRNEEKLIEENEKNSPLSDLHTVRQGWHGKTHLC